MAKEKVTPNMEAEVLSFEGSLAALEAIIHDLEEGQVSLGDALARYEEGVKHLKHCYEFLATAERKIELLTGIDAEGRPVTAPFDEGATSLEEKAEKRSQRRTSGKAASPPKSSPPASDVDDPDTLF